MEIYTDGTYMQRNQSWHQEDSPWKAQQIARIISDNGVNFNEVCEIGCGAGNILKCLYDSHVIVSGDGYDVSSQAIDLCKSKEHVSLKFFCGDFLEDFSSTYDLAIVADVFEHVEDYLGFLRKLRPRAAHKVFHIPLDLSVQTVLRGTPLKRVREIVGHLHYFTCETALESLRHVGYEIIDWRYTSSGLDLPNRSFMQRLAQWPRWLCYKISPEWTVRVLGGYSLLVLGK